MIKEDILKQVKDLPPDLTQGVIDFIEFLKMKRFKKGLFEKNFLFIQQNNLRKIWDSEEEDLYEL